MEHKDTFFSLPLGVTGRIDVGRLLREIELLNEFMHQASIREPGSAMQLPKTSRLFDELVQSNSLNMLKAEDRSRLHAFLQEVKTKAPLFHISFSADASPLFMQRLIKYIRSELHPLALVQVGLQPSIGAGCMFRTTNKFFDLSLRQRLKEKKPLLTTQLKKIHEKQAQSREATPLQSSEPQAQGVNQ